MDVREKLVELLRNKPRVKPPEGVICGTEVYSIDATVDYLIAHGVTVQEWISVKERLPQEDLPFGALCEVVQVLLNDGSVTIGWCNRGLRLWFHMPIRETKVVAYEYKKTPVIAWQPLAQPPKGE